MDHFEESIPMNTNNNINQCNSCRRSESTDRMKLTEHSSQITALKNEEMKLKILHRRLEMRIKQFLHRTHNSILMEEKLIDIEKCSQKKLLLHQNFIIPKKSSKKEYKIIWNNIKQTEENNKQLEKNISSLCHKIKQIENDFQLNKQYKIQQNNNKTLFIPNENQLHRINTELNKISANNTQLRIDIKQMLDKRRKMIEEYNRLNIIMQNATNESRQLTFECSESFANRRNLIERMRSMCDEDERDEKKLLDDIREFDRLLENNNTSKNFLIKKSNMRQEQIQLNELFAGKRSEGTKCAYTADEFRRLFQIYFNQNFVKEKVLNRTVETFLNEQEHSFALFEYAVELINELDHLHENLENKRIYISNIFSNDNIDSFITKDIFSKLEYSVNTANRNVQSLDIAKKNLRQLLDTAYELISNLFFEINCDKNVILSFHQTINDRNILLYLATIENHVQQLLLNKKRYQKDGRHHHHHYTDDTTISWRIDHQSYNSLLKNSKENNQNVLSSNLHEIDFSTPQILLNEEIQMIDDGKDNKKKLLLEEIVNSVLNVYNECIHTSNTHLENNVNVIEQINNVK